jgi:hypothetical protein
MSVADVRLALRRTLATDFAVGSGARHGELVESASNRNAAGVPLQTYAIRMKSTITKVDGIGESPRERQRIHHYAVRSKA